MEQCLPIKFHYLIDFDSATMSKQLKAAGASKRPISSTSTTSSSSAPETPLRKRSLREILEASGGGEPSSKVASPARDDAVIAMTVHVLEYECAEGSESEDSIFTFALSYSYAV
jgi:hypothetical protein